MKKELTITILTLLAALLFVGCSKTVGVKEAVVTNSLFDLSNGVSSTAETEQSQQVVSSSEEAALTVYSSLLSGDMTLLEDTQTEQWWIPDFQDEGMDYEYTYSELDGDGTMELIVQMVDDPCGYNAVFHFENDKIFCWNSDAMEGSCRDYPLNDGTMVRQYDYNGTRSYTVFRYQANGKQQDISYLFAREVLIPEDSLEPCPYYKINGNEVNKAVFDEQLAALVTDRILERSAWKLL